MTEFRPTGDRTLIDVVERILDKGIVLNADISISVAGTELLGITIRATLSSFETAAKYGMGMPSGTDMSAPGWEEAYKKKARCPDCENLVEEQLLIDEGCPICGWVREQKRKVRSGQ